MKNIILIIICAIIPFLATAQQKSIEAFYEKYSELDNVTNVNMNGTLLKFAASDDANETTINKVTNLRVLVMEETNYVDYRDLKQLRRAVLQKGFEDLINVREGTSKVEILLREKDNIITNVLVIVNDVDGFVLLSIEGLFHLKDLQDLDIDVEGIEHLNKIAKTNKYDRA